MKRVNTHIEKTPQQISAGKEKDKTSKKQKVETKSGGSAKAKKTASEKSSVKATQLEGRSVGTQSTTRKTSNTVVPAEGSKDIFNLVAKQLPAEALKAVRATNKVSEALANEHVKFSITPSDLYTPTFWEQFTDLLDQMYGQEPTDRITATGAFAPKSNIPINITVRTAEDAEKLIQFLNSPDSKKISTNIDKITINAVNVNSNKQIQDLLNLIPQKCPNITSLALGDIMYDVNLTFPEGLKKLTSLSIQDIYERTVITFPEDLSSLKTLSTNGIGGTLLIPRGLKSLIDIKLGTVFSQGVVTFPDDLRNKLTIGGYYSGATVTFPKIMNNLNSLSLGYISKGISLTLPEELNNLDSLDYDARAIQGTPIHEQLKVIQKGIEKRKQEKS